MNKAPTGRDPHSVGHHSWGRISSAVVAITALGLTFAIHYSAAVPINAGEDDLHQQIGDLRLRVKQLEQKQTLPATVLERYRGSIGYIAGSYRVGFPNLPPQIEARISGTGFLISHDVVVTNRHIAEPWFGDSDAELLIRRGAKPTLESLLIFFPGLTTPIPLGHGSVSRASDVAILHIQNPDLTRGLAVLPLAEELPSIGEPIVVIGYPLGISGMIAKLEPAKYQRLAGYPKDLSVARKLAAQSLIRPLIGFGHLGDIVGDHLIYDAPTAHGSSGGPVLNLKGEVVAVSFAYAGGFTGENMGVGIESLRSLLMRTLAVQEDQRHR